MAPVSAKPIVVSMEEILYQKQKKAKRNWKRKKANPWVLMEQG